ncbi:MAG: hypothetical protein ACPGID_01735 [Rubricella sp.]
MQSSANAFLASAAIALSASGAAAQADETTARNTWIAFECAVYADFIGDEALSTALFERGLRDGRAFLQALDDPAQDVAALTADAPVGLTRVLDGPNEEFILGRMFAASEDYAMDRVIERGLDLSFLDLSDRVFNSERQAEKAAILYERADCSRMEN